MEKNIHERMGITQAQIKKIHAMINEVRLMDDEYRAMLKSLFNVESSKDLSFQQAKIFINKLNDIWRKNKKLTPTQLSKISHLASEIYKTDTYKRLKECILRNIGYDVAPSLLSRKEASKIIYVLEEIKRWQERQK